MLHYAVNKLAGMTWGEPDLAPLLPWLARYASWLEDRVRLNRFRQAYLYIVKGAFTDQAQKDKRQRELNANPPEPGTVLVMDNGESWEVINPRLDSFDANADGLALKKFIAGGQGIPLHWLAEPESSTRTTAEAAGTPSFKTLEERQKFLLMTIKEVLEVCLERSMGLAAGVQSPRTRREAEISVTAADISERDNAALALAATQIVASFGQLVAGGYISADEYMRVVYRFAGEVLPASRPDAAAADVAPVKSSKPTAGVHVDSKSGDVNIPEEEGDL
jgi:hypothetical protein